MAQSHGISFSMYGYWHQATMHHASGCRKEKVIVSKVHICFDKCREVDPKSGRFTGWEVEDSDDDELQ